MLTYLGILGKRIWCLHCDGVSAEGVEDVGGAGEVEHQLVGPGVRHAFDLHTAHNDHQTTVDQLALRCRGSWVRPPVNQLAS